MQPTLIVVTGSPATGKSSVAALLSQRLGLPLVSRDAIKSAIVRTMAPDAEQLRRGGPVAQQSFTYFAEAIDFHIERSLSLIVEHAFEHGKGEAFLRPFIDRSKTVQIVCRISTESAVTRFERRMTERVRSNLTDAEILGMFRDGRLGPHSFALELDPPTHTLDCEDIGTPSWSRRFDEMAGLHSIAWR